MNKPMILLLAGTTVAAGSVLAAVKTAGPFEQTAITAAEATTETGPIRHDSLSSGFAKDGAGDYTLPLGTVVQKSPLNLSVRQGKVKLTDNGTAAVVTAPACINDKAAMWLDANDLTAGAVETWLDHREATSDQNKYPCMKQTTAEKQPTAGADAASKKWVNFGGVGSGKYGPFYNTARSGTTKLNVVHAFLVAKVENTAGFWFGANQNYYVTFHAGAYSSSSLSGSYWNDANSSPAVMAGQTYLDGERIPGATTSVKTGIQLIEWEAGERAAQVMNFFNDRGIAGRQGGDNIGEVVFFTSRLSDAERQQVEMYLMQKWEGACQPAQAAVKLAPGATVETDGSVSAPMTVRGNGTVEKTRAAAQYYGDARQGVSAATWHLANGGMTLEKGETKLALGSGEALASDKDAYGVTTLSRTTDVEAGATAITGGAGAYRLESIPASSSNVTITCGTLSLGSQADPVDGAAVPTTDGTVFATMANPGFESFSGQQWNSGSWSSQGWTFSKGEVTASGSAWFIFQKGVGNYASYGGNVPMPEGSYSMGFNFNGDKKGSTATASTTVAFPCDGDYLLTFADAPRYPTWEGASSDNYNAYAGTEVELALTREGFDRNSIATYYINGLWKKDAYRPERFLVRNVKAGSYTFEIKMTKMVDGGERLSIFDDFKFRLVESESTETVFPVPNGDFEHYSLATPATFDLNRTAPGWAFTDTSGGANACVGPMTPQVLGAIGGSWSAEATYMPLPWFLSGGQYYGQGQLAFFGNQGTATTAAFVPPAGKWRLRCRVAHTTSGMLKWNDAVINGQGNFTVSLSKNGAAEASLGTIYVTSSEFVSATFPTAFSCNGTDSVVLKLGQSNASGNLRVDDLELVRDDNLVADGGFSDPVASQKMGAWTTSCWTEMPNYSQYYGKTVLDGRALLVGRQGYAYQTVDFAEAGLYRLSFWARGRAHYNNADDALPLMNFAQNRVRFTLEKDSAVREIYRSEKVNSTNFVHYTALFKVETVGDYTFRLQGTDTEDHNAWIDNVRIDKVSAAQAPELPENATIKVRLGEGEKLRLDYPGTATVRTLKVNGRSLHGTVNESTYPDYVTGPGSVNVTYRPGLVVVVK